MFQNIVAQRIHHADEFLRRYFGFVYLLVNLELWEIRENRRDVHESLKHHASRHIKFATVIDNLKFSYFEIFDSLCQTQQVPRRHNVHVGGFPQARAELGVRRAVENKIDLLRQEGPIVFVDAQIGFFAVSRDERHLPEKFRVDPPQGVEDLKEEQITYKKLFRR